MYSIKMIFDISYENMGISWDDSLAVRGLVHILIADIYILYLPYCV